MNRIRKIFLQNMLRRNGYRRCHGGTFIIRTKMFGDVYFSISPDGKARLL